MSANHCRYFGHLLAAAVALTGSGLLAGDSPLPAAPLMEPPGEGGTDMPFTLKSSAFDEGGSIPVKYTGDGEDVSPALEWSNAPEGTRAFALVCDDPDAPAGAWVHWLIYAIPENPPMLPEAVPPKRELANGARQGINDFRKLGYGGPAPPPGAAHRYYFRLYALDSALELAPGIRKANLMKAMEGHILGRAELMGRYKR